MDEREEIIRIIEKFLKEQANNLRLGLGELNVSQPIILYMESDFDRMIRRGMKEIRDFYESA